MTFLELAKRILTEEKKPLSSSEIWDIAVRNGYNNLVATKGKTPVATLSVRLYCDIRDNKDSHFSKVGTMPRRFQIKNLPINNEPISTGQAQDKRVIQKKMEGYKEIDIHPFLTYYVYTRLEIYTKTINHITSKKKDFGEWVHPDMVGCYYPIENWQDDVVDFSVSIGNMPIKLFSFEIKRELTFGNLRESFFQSVSNSSWAHEGYLVAVEISQEDDFTKELKRLSSSFGIGVIRIDIKDPDSSETLFPAKTKENLDWETINKLATMNPDFSSFISRVNNVVKTRKIEKVLYDKVFSPEALISTNKE
ncbi:MAG: hypothetical protein HQL04_05770 [Nitrospirae bacterium]|nr:hypothetical protein [Nitrospirota bacterium]